MTPPDLNGYDPKFINPFILATHDLLTKKAGVCRMAKKKMAKKTSRILFGDISGVMGVTGNLKGAVSLSFSNSLAEGFVASMEDKHPSELKDEELIDGVATIIEEISRQAQGMLLETPYSFMISSPSVIRGPRHELHLKPGTLSVEISFEADGEPLVLQLSIDSKEN